MSPKTYGPYTPLRSAGGLYFLSGQVGIDPVTKATPKDIASQSSQALMNAQTLLETEGLTLDDAVKLTVYLCDMQDFEAMNTVYESFFTVPRPARTTVAVKELPRIGTKPLLVEIELTASRRNNDTSH